MVLTQRIVHSVLDVFSSPQCRLCDRPTHAILCDDCQIQFLSCQYTEPQQFWHPPLPVFAWGHYTGTLKQGIAALKYHNQPEIAQLLGQWLGNAWMQSTLVNAPPTKTSRLANGVSQRNARRSLVVIPVPANEAKKKRRGYDQAELIAKAFCRTTRLSLDLHRVYRIEDTVPMHSLSRQERQGNVQGKFRLHPRVAKTFKRQVNKQGNIPQKKAPAILLLDDIHTSGATLNAIAHLLRQHQMSVYGAVTVAKAGVGQDGP